MLLHGLVVRIEGGLEQAEGGEAADHLRHVLRLIELQPAAQQLALAVAQPLLDQPLLNRAGASGAGW